jgi:hypothetical protein
LNRIPKHVFAVTVTVAALAPLLAAIVAGETVRVDCVAETLPAVTVTVAVSVIGTLLIVADTTFASAAVELRVPVATPLASVVPADWVTVSPCRWPRGRR